MDFFSIIMAGGRGKRFWPSSRRKTPKQFLPIDGHHSLLKTTFLRLSKKQPIDKIVVAGNYEHREHIFKHLPELKPENLFLEPVGKNTAACIALAAVMLKHRGHKGVMAIMPSDHYIQDDERFLYLLEKGAEMADKGYVVTLGIMPNRIETGYGYINKSAFQMNIGEIPVFNVERFVEKPDYQSAREFVESEEYFWNSGIFLFEVDKILQLFEQYMPEASKILRKIEHELNQGMNTDDTLKEYYPQLPNISIDYGIMEKVAASGEMCVIPADFGWSDVGSWASLSEIIDSDTFGNVVVGETELIDVNGCIIHSPGKMVAAIGLDDIAIINTDDILLLCPLERSQEVKKIVEALEKKGKKNYL